MTPRRRDRGFSLLELVLVMIILFTVTGVVAPRFSDFFPSLQVNKTADHLLAWARRARTEAATTGLRQRLVIDADQRKFWIAVERDPFNEPDEFMVLPGAWGEQAFPDEVVFEELEGFTQDGSKRSLEFLPDGTSKDAAITLGNDRGDRRVLRITGATSQATLEPEEPRP
jgi:Tfp pilus assembly protein FimT